MFRNARAAIKTNIYILQERPKHLLEKKKKPRKEHHFSGKMDIRSFPPTV